MKIFFKLNLLLQNSIYQLVTINVLNRDLHVKDSI